MTETRSVQRSPHPPQSILKKFRNMELTGTDRQAVLFHLEDCKVCSKFTQEEPSAPMKVVQSLLDTDDSQPSLCNNFTVTSNMSPSPSPEPLRPPPIDAKQLLPDEIRNHARYDIMELIGVGGMGSVYKAWDRRQRAFVAIKIINSQTDREHIARFRREVDLQRKLNDKHIVAAYDTETIGQTSFLVMEFLEGIGVERLIVRQGMFSLADACEIIRQAAIGLHHAHQFQLVHRDIKPSNLFVTKQGTVKVLDFGLSRLTEAAAQVEGGMHSMRLTGEKQAVGTMEYMAPEQAIDSRSVDSRADIYSLGATLYTLLTGKPPPLGAMGQETDAWSALWLGKINSRVPSISDRRSEIPKVIDEIIAKMLSVIPEDRYANALEVAREISPFAQGANLFTIQGLETPPEVRPESKPISAFRRNAAIAVASGIIGFMLAFIFATPSRNAAPPPVVTPTGPEQQK